MFSEKALFIRIPHIVFRKQVNDYIFSLNLIKIKFLVMFAINISSKNLSIEIKKSKLRKTIEKGRFLKGDAQNETHVLFLIFICYCILFMLVYYLGIRAK